MVRILPSKSIEYGKIPTKKVKVGFRVAMARQPLRVMLDSIGNSFNVLHFHMQIYFCHQIAVGPQMGDILQAFSQKSVNTKMEM